MLPMPTSMLQTLGPLLVLLLYAWVIFAAPRDAGTSWHHVLFWGVLAGLAASSAHEVLVLLLLAVAAGTLVARELVFAALAFTGPVATVVALACAVSVVALLAGVVVRLHHPALGPMTSGLAFLTAPFARSGLTRAAMAGVPVRRSRWSALGRPVFLLSAVAGAVWWLSRQTAMMDWNHLLQKLSAIAIWIAAFAAVYGMRRTIHPAVTRTAIAWLLLGATVPAVTWRALDTVEDRVPGWAGDPRLSVRILDGHAGRDPSFKVIDDTVSAAATGDEGEFYDLLQRHTNIPREVRVEPVAVNLVEVLAPGAAPAPHLFVFVIDSLRQDYVSPYNARVTFTPAIDAFVNYTDYFFDLNRDPSAAANQVARVYLPATGFSP